MFKSFVLFLLFQNSFYFQNYKKIYFKSKKVPLHLNKVINMCSAKEKSWHEVSYLKISKVRITKQF